MAYNVTKTQLGTRQYIAIQLEQPKRCQGTPTGPVRTKVSWSTWTYSAGVALHLCQASSPPRTRSEYRQTNHHPLILNVNIKIKLHVLPIALLTLASYHALSNILIWWDSMNNQIAWLVSSLFESQNPCFLHLSKDIASCKDLQFELALWQQLIEKGFPRLRVEAASSRKICRSNM